MASSFVGEKFLCRKTQIGFAFGLVLFTFLSGTALVGQVSEKAKEKLIEMACLLPTEMAFSFEAGKLVKVNVEAKRPNFDLAWDPETGLAANNSKLLGPFKGKGGIVDVGQKKLEDVSEAPKSGYTAFIEHDGIKVGHTYCVVMADGDHYGKIHIIRYNKSEGELVFTWRYQANDSRKFD
jgi:hypothetical protein